MHLNNGSEQSQVYSSNLKLKIVSENYEALIMIILYYIILHTLQRFTENNFICKKNDAWQKYIFRDLDIFENFSISKKMLVHFNNIP